MSEEDYRAFQATVHGRVQGVGFRYYTRDFARRHNITGWVKNRADGTVEVYAEGTAEAVATFEEWLKNGGPPSARINHVDFRRPKAIGAYPRFTVEY